MPQSPKALTLDEHCVFCELKGPKTNMVECQQCDDFYHLACCGIPAKKHEIALEMIQLLGWSCKDCRLDNRNFKIKMQEEMSNLQLQLDALLARSLAATEAQSVSATTTSNDPAPHATPTDKNLRRYNGNRKNESENDKMSYSDVVKVVSKAVTDCTRRKRNVIITGLTEDESVDDIDVVTDLFGSVLHMNIRQKIVMMRRLGQITESQTQSRKLLVSLDNEETANDILNRSFMLIFTISAKKIFY